MTGADPRPPPPIPLFGVAFDALTLDEAVRRVAARPAGDGFRYVVTPNIDHLVRLDRVPDLRAIYAGAFLRVLDSQALALAARLVGLPAPPVLSLIHI